MSSSINDLRYVAIRQHLRQLRQESGLTQTQLAARLNEGQSNVSKVERGERFVDLLLYMDWCTACGASPAAAMARLLAHRSPGASEPDPS